MPSRFYGAPRFTGDIDILVRPTPENASKIIDALDAFGFGSLGLKAEDFEQLGRVVQLGVPPVRIDLVTSLTGVTWEEAWIGEEPGKYGEVAVYYLGREQLVRNKRALGRKKDLADLEALGEHVTRRRHHSPSRLRISFSSSSTSWSSGTFLNHLPVDEDLTHPHPAHDPEVRLARLAGAVHRAPHDGDLDGFS